LFTQVHRLKGAAIKKRKKGSRGEKCIIRKNVKGVKKGGGAGEKNAKKI